MTTQKILFSLVLCGLISPLFAQIKGVVSDSESNPTLCNDSSY
jgi:hypothetical protein